MFKSPSYKVVCCNADCWFEDYATEDQPCWGDVDAIPSEDDWTWIHACQGHRNYDWTGNESNIYIKEPKTR